MKEKNKMVTAIITTYKRPVEVLERAVKSIVNQTYDNIEIIIVNDAPNDKKLENEIKEMLTKYETQRKILFISLEHNSGACIARNKGIENSQGEYIAFLDDDDEWLENKIEKQEKELEKDNSVAIVYNNFIIYNEDTKKERLAYLKKQPEGVIYEELLGKNIIGSCSFPMFRKDILLKYGGFREKMPAFQDLELYLRICRENKVKYIEQPLVRYHLYEGERISKNVVKRTEAFEIIHKENYKHIQNNKVCKYTFYLFGANVYSNAGDLRNALKYYNLAIKNNLKNILRNCKVLIKIILKRFKKKNNL